MANSLPKKVLREIEPRQNLAYRILESAGQKYLDFFEKISLEKSLDKRKEEVAEFEKLIETEIMGEIEAKFSKDGLIGEEGNKWDDSKNGIYWIIDPLDGSSAFARLDDRSSITVSLLYRKKREDRIILGMVYDFFRGKLYKSSDAEDKVIVEKTRVSLGQEKIRRLKVSGSKYLPDARINHDYNFFYENDEQQKLWSKNLAKIIKQSDVKTRGSVALNICQVVEGVHQLYFSHQDRIYLHDYSAAGKILIDAGGCLKSLKQTAEDKENLDITKITNSIIAGNSKGIVNSFLKSINRQINRQSRRKSSS